LGDRYLVTGGAGFIGSNLVARLLADDHTVRVLDDWSTGRHQNLQPFMADLDLIEGSVTDQATCRRACADVDFVLHQAAIPSVARSVQDPVASHKANANGTLNMLVAARDAGVQRFVYAASSSAYGNTPTLPKVEDMAQSPRSPYAVAKLAGEQYARTFHAVYGLETVALRYFNIFGPRQDPTSQYSAAIPIFITHAFEGRPPTIHGDGEQTRDFTFVDNAVHANLRACRAPAENVAGSTFNVGCGERISVNRLWGEICEAVGTQVEPEYGPTRAGDVRDSLASLEQSRRLLGYEIQVDLAEGLRRTVDWFRPEEA